MLEDIWHKIKKGVGDLGPPRLFIVFKLLVLSLYVFLVINNHEELAEKILEVFYEAF